MKMAVLKALLPGAPVPGLDQVSRDIDAQHVRPESRRRDRGRPVAAAEIQDLEPARDPEPRDERFPAFSHGLRDASEVSLLPERLVRIHQSVTSKLLPPHAELTGTNHA